MRPRENRDYTKYRIEISQEQKSNPRSVRIPNAKMNEKYRVVGARTQMRGSVGRVGERGRQDGGSILRSLSAVLFARPTSPSLNSKKLNSIRNFLLLKKKKCCSDVLLIVALFIDAA